MVVDDDLKWLNLEPEPLKTITRRRTKLVVGLDDLLADEQLAKRKPEPEPRTKKRRYVSSDDDEDDDEEQEIGRLIQRCTAEVESDLLEKEAPKWGETVFGPQKPPPECSEPDILKSLAATAASLSCFASETRNEPHEQADTLFKLFSGSWIRPLVTSEPVIQKWIFHTMAFTEDRHVERSACEILCEPSSFDEHGSDLWRPKLAEILEAFRTYGYEGTSATSAGLEGIGPPANVISLLDFTRCCCEKRDLRLFTTAEAQELLRVLARCLLDPRLVALSCSLQDCIEALVDYFSAEEWSLCFESVASCLARISEDPFNVLHVAKKLRGARDRVEQLHREISFQLLSDMARKELSRCPEDIVSVLSSRDPRAPDMDFVKLHHSLNLADLWLRNEPGFISKDAAAFTKWMEVLRTLSVRISCGDYRTYATKVRNRAAFLASMYSNLT